MAGGDDFCLRHALGFAADLWRMCVINREPAKVASRKLGLDQSQVEGAVRLLKSCRQLPCVERLACVVMLDPGLDDSDIAEIFGRSKRWAEDVRSQAKSIRVAEPLEKSLEYLDEHLQPGMPTPSEIEERAAHVRKTWTPRRFGERKWVEIKAFIYGSQAFENLPWCA